MRLQGLVVAGLVACGNGDLVPPPEAPAPRHKPVDIGDHVPDLHVKNITSPGKPPIGVVPGKVNIVWFFATWSGPDKQAMPKAQAAWTALRERGLVMVAVSVDDESRGLPEFGRENGATFDLGWDEGHRMAERYAPGSEPTWYVVDRKGIVRFIHFGYHDGEFEIMKPECESLL